MTAHSDRAHARLAPSSAHRVIPCPGSLRMSEGIHETPSAFAAEGTAAHTLAERCMAHGTEAAQWRGWTIDTKPGAGMDPWFRPGHPNGAPNGTTRFLVNAEMVESVQEYLDVVRELAEDSDEFEVEQRVDISDLVAGVFGTGDAIAYKTLPEGGRVTIADLKYGRGVAVDAAENEQLLTYAAGIAQRYHNRGVSEVELIIVQPRAPHRDGPVRRWRTDMVGLFEHIVALQGAAELASRPDAPLKAGEWCKFCKAAGICPALRSRVDEILGAERLNGEIVKMSDPATVPYRDWKIEEAELAMVKGWLKRREEHAHAEALRGSPPPGSKLVGKRPTRKWIDEGCVPDALRMMGLEDDDIYETSLASPATIEPLMPGKNKAERAAALGALAEKVSSGSVLAPLDDPRPAINPGDARGFEAQDI
jgi:hypothetical protein